MHQGNWKCSSCGGAITELPFEPRSEAGLTCRTCYAKSKSNQSASASDGTLAASEAPAIPEDATIAGEPAPMPDFDHATPATPGERPAFTGDWQCATCGSSITSLPFEPRSTNNLKCIDCFKQGKG